MSDYGHLGRDLAKQARDEAIAQAVAAERAACLAIARALEGTTYWDDPSAGIAAQIERRDEVAEPDTAGQIAERARCAQVARDAVDGGPSVGWKLACEQIAQAIERGEG